MYMIKLNETYIGTVLKIDKENRRVGVYIPKLMPTLYSGDATEYKYPTNSGLNVDLTNVNISSTVTKTNYMWVKGENADDPLPDIGSKVRIVFLDESPRLPYWRKFNYNGDYSVIEEERYPKLINLQVNNHELEVNTADEILLEVPDYYSIVSEQQEKTKKISIQDNFNF